MDAIAQASSNAATSLIALDLSASAKADAVALEGALTSTGGAATNTAAALRINDTTSANSYLGQLRSSSSSIEVDFAGLNHDLSSSS
jgi:hypothetical protein